MKKTLLLVGLMAGSLCFAGAKSYTLTISTPAKIGSAILKPGEYKMSVAADSVKFMNLDNGKSVEVKAKFNKSEKSFEMTQMSGKTVDGVNKVDEIDLGGTTTRVEFE